MTGNLINNRYELIKQIDEGGISKIYLAKDIETKREVIFRSLKKEKLSDRIEDIIRFRNEAGILSRLDHPNIVKIYEAGEYDGENYIVMEYVPGESLYKSIRNGKHFQENEIIEILIQVCRALDHIHCQNIIHRDLKPGNIMAYTGGKGSLQIRVIDFGLALVKEYTALNSEEEIAGTFSYMSPEHFGMIRLNVDERSDLYSLGIIGYQLLTGVLPFDGKSAGTIIHQQIAKLPVPLTKHNREIPSALERIILKLLEKEPDRRYQSAKGLIFDLEKYKKGERDFTPGINDRQVHFSFKTELVSREEELKTLKNLYVKAVQGKGGVCFINGEAGMGKTRLAEELRSYVYKEGGVFIDGKCFSGKNKTPYGPLKDALNIYLKIYQKYPEQKKLAIKNKLNEMAGGLSGIILQFNPSFSIIFDRSPELVRLETDREKKRFLMVLSRLFLNLSNIETSGEENRSCGLVLFLDDLQWTDEGSMDLLEEISGDLSKYHLLIIGTYRNNEIGPEHRLNRYKADLKKNHNSYHEISLDYFSKDQINQFIKSLLYTRGEDNEEISEIIYKKSKGNPFFAIEILKQFIDEKAINRGENGWVFDNDMLNRTEIAATIVDIVIKRISLLSEEDTKFLSYAAVIGKKFDIKLLFRLLDYEPPEIIRKVDRAIALQLLEEDMLEKGKILFTHDRIKEAFYKKCGDEERKLLHNQIARTIEEMNRDHTEKVIFDLAYHYIEGEDDKKILKYGYPAGIKAMENYAYEEALRYLSLVSRIAQGKGEEFRELWINANKNISEIFLVIGRNDEAIEIGTQILPFINDKLDQADINKKISTAYLKKGDWKNCEEFGRKGLSLLGEKLPVGGISVILRIAYELFIHILHSLFPVFFIQRKEHSQKEKYKLIIQFYLTLNWMYILSDVKKFVGSILRMLNLAERKLIKSPELGTSIAGYASLCMALPLFKRAIRFHEKALRLRKEMNDEWGIAQSMQFLGYCYQWKGEFKKSNHYFNESYTIFKKIGDLWETKAVLLGLEMNYHYLGNYNKTLECIEENIKICEQVNDNYGISSVMDDYSIIYHRKGEYELAIKYEEKALQIAGENKIGLINCVVQINLGVIYKDMGEYQKSIENLEKAIDLNEKNDFLKHYTIHAYLHLADTLIEKFKTDIIYNNKDRTGALTHIRKIVEKALREAKVWATYYGDALRVYAQYNALISKKKKAGSLFLQSISFNTKLERQYELGKSYYEYGLFLRESEYEEDAKKNFECAYMVFKEIDSKVYLKRVSEALGITEEGSDAVRKLKYRERLSTIIKVSQTIGSILDLNLLLKNIISLALEITGARRGYLLIKDDKTGKLALKIKKSVHEEENTESEADSYSGNIVETVFKNGTAVLSDNALKDDRYSKYNSVVQYGLKSVLCVPIRLQNAILGVCYLDNPLSSSVFSGEDTEILEAIMTQAAVSIENAKLYENMMKLKNKAENEAEKLTIHILKKHEKFLDEKTSIVYRSAQMKNVVEKVNQAASIMKPILITGETGTGKELVAKLIHYSRNHKGEPFIAFNCAAVPRDLWESELFGYVKGAFTDAKENREGNITAAGKGTLFFDEIGEMPPEIQSKLLRLLQENQYRALGSNIVKNAECRFVFATNRNIENMIKEGTFREDLYYRISVFMINIPPLRERRQDIEILLDYFLKKYAKEFDLQEPVEIEEKAMNKIMSFSWPGNARQIENFIIRSLAVISSSNDNRRILRISDFPADIFSQEDKTAGNEKTFNIEEEIPVNGNFEEILNRHAHDLILWSLKKSGGNKSGAAKILGIKRSTLIDKMKKLKLE